MAICPEYLQKMQINQVFIKIIMNELFNFVAVWFT